MNSNYKFPRHLIYGVSAHSLNMWHTTVNKDIDFYLVPIINQYYHLLVN